MYKKVFSVCAEKGDTKVFLPLPAAPYELLDAMDKLRADEGKTAKFEIGECYRFDCLEDCLPNKYKLPGLNALARRLLELDGVQQTVFEGLVRIAAQKGDGSIGLPEVINMAYSTDCCHVVGEVLNDAQLGRFCAENGFVPDVEGLPDSLFELLDFRRIGREHRQAENGVFVEGGADCPNGYVEQHSELHQVYETLDLRRKAPDYTILLEMSKGFFNDAGYDSDKTMQLKLPASEETLSDVFAALNVWDWRKVGWRCLDCKIPALAKIISDGEDGIEYLNDIARRWADMEPKTVAVYKALLSAADCRTLPQAEQLMDTLDEYILTPQYSSPVEVAKEELSAVLYPQEQELILPYLNLYLYGQAVMERDGCILTEYGMVGRTDGQPVQAALQQAQQGGMEMKM